MQEENSKKITVKLRKAGWEVEITCSESELKHAIESVLSSLQESPPTISGGKEAGRLNDAGNKTCKGLIIELWEDAWFARPRALSEVHEEIARRGYHYDRTAVSHSLRELVIENVLTREGNMRNYTYIQKRPPGFTSAPTSEGAEDEE
ncbi:MAG: hypothetical protein ACRECH_16285 [Nitrososphaerales archaeon]